MLKPYHLLLLLLLVFACSKPSQAISNSDAEQQIDAANTFIQQLHNKSYSQARSNFDTQMLEAMDEKLLKKTWETINSQAGSFKEVLNRTADTVEGYTRIFLSSQFEHAILDVIVVFNSENKIAGLFFKPSNYKPENKAPAPKAGIQEFDEWTEENVKFGDSAWLLPATITYPKNTSRSPLVILVHGSGPNDRDESIGPNKPFKDIAHGLAKHGIATLRYEKRTREHSSRIAENISKLTSYEETVDDVIHAVNYAKSLSKVNNKRIFVAGHSFGGMLIPRIAMHTSDAAGFIMLAAPARPMEELLPEQFNYIFNLDGELSTEEKSILDNLQKQIKQVHKLDQDKTIPSSDLPLGMHQSYWMDLNAYNILESAKKITRPLFIIQGKRDYQVLADKDFALWQSEMQTKNVSLKLYPDLNHLMISGQGKSTPEEYNIPGHVSKELINDIASWINNI